MCFPGTEKQPVWGCVVVAGIASSTNSCLAWRQRCGPANFFTEDAPVAIGPNQMNSLSNSTTTYIIPDSQPTVGQP